MGECEFLTFSSDDAFLSSKDQKEKVALFVIRVSKINSLFVTQVPRQGHSETEVAVYF